MTNDGIADVFTEIADRLEIEGANPFRIRAYRTAARNLEGLTEPLSDRVDEGEDLTGIEGIGEDLSAKIIEIVTTGSCKALKELKGRIPDSLILLTRIQGLGPKRVGQLYKELHIESISDLEQALEEGSLEELKGFGSKMIENIRQGLDDPSLTEVRFLRASVEATVQQLLSCLRDAGDAKQVEVAGSYRRWKETVGDLDLLVCAEDAKPFMSALVEFEDVDRVLQQGDKKASVVLRRGLQVDLRVVPASSFGAALHYFTGSKEHNVAMRRLAQSRDLKMNEYGLFSGDDQVVGATEKEMYQELDLPWIPPELREERGELSADVQGDLPALVEEQDIRCDLHMHSDGSDGRHTIREMAEAAAERGYEVIAITDHSQRLTVAHGLDADRLKRQMDEIDQLNEDVDGIHILKGLEVDILEDGSLDMDDDTLSALDLVIASIHSKMQLDRKTQTERMLEAMEHPAVTCIGHPTGRLLLRRPPMDLDMEAILDRAAERGIWMEINANPMRLDLNDHHIRMALERDIPLAINTDAHRMEDLDVMKHGVGQARRGWAETGQIVNTLSRTELEKRLKNRS